MAVALLFSCDGEDCRRRENARLRRLRDATHRSYDHRPAHQTFSTVEGAEVYDFGANGYDIEWNGIHLPGDWRVVGVERSKRHPHGMMFICPDCGGS